MRVPRQQRLERDVGVALAELRLGTEHEVGVDAQVGGEEALEHLLAGDVVADAGLRRDGVAQELEHRPPRAGVGHRARQPVEGVQIDRERPHVVVGVAQEGVEKPADGLVGNGQHGAAVDHLADAQQAEEMQQGEEVLPSGQSFDGKPRLEVAGRPLLAGDVAQQIEVAVELPADHEQMAQLPVVHPHVRIDQVLRHGPVRHGLVQVVQHHVGVVDAAFGVRGEPVAVVPVPHGVQRLVDVLIEHAPIAVRLQQPAHLRLGEAEQLVEVGLQADVVADVEAAGHVVERDRRHAGDEQPLQSISPGAGLQRREEVAVEAAAVGNAVVGRLAVVGEDGVGEVVVLVDQHVGRNAVVAGVHEQLVQHAGNGNRRENAARRRFGKQVGIAFQCMPDLQPAVFLEVALQRLQRVVESREIEAQHDVAMPLVRRFAADVGAAEHALEGVGAVAVVVVLQQ